jgi:hypothetical protein
MARRGQVRPFPGGSRIFHRMFTRLGIGGRPPHFVVEFFPYANLAQTIRLREETAHVRLSDLLRDAPLSVLEAAAALLLGRAYRRRVPSGLAAVYRNYALSDETRRRLHRVRRIRGRRATVPPDNRHRVLLRRFARLNRRYFGGKLPRPHLVWSPRPWRSQFGCFDPALSQIVINCRLQRKDAPASVVDYVLYHEMLHMKHPMRRATCGLQSHSKEFRREEKRFADYERARRWLSRLP